MSQEDSLWLTYAEAAVRLQIDADSVKRRAQRQKWPRRASNDGRTLVAVPVSALPEGDIAGAGGITPKPEPLAALINRLTSEAIAAHARAAAAEATVQALERELRRWVRRAPARHPGVVLKRISRLARG